MLSGGGKVSSRVTSKAKCPETTTAPSGINCHSYHSVSDWSELAFFTH